MAERVPGVTIPMAIEEIAVTFHPLTIPGES